MTTALYRRYRPDTFAEVIGQEHVTEPLMQALRTGKVTHAYLFSGPRGCGKTTSARILARCLNCAQGPTATPCGECDSCVELARGGAGSLDVVEIDAASHNGVDDARDLRERAAFAPARDRYKVFILDEAHMVTPQGFNALLKIVEEPPPHVKFIFATTEPDKVIGTIRSRTHHYPFRLVPPDVLTPYLDQVCAAEQVPVGPGVLPLVVRAGGGSVRDSMSVLDQLVAGADERGLDYERAVALLGFTHAALLDDAVDAIAVRDGASAFRVVDRVISSGHEPRRFVEDLLERLRDLIVIAASGEAARAVLRDVPADQMERMADQAATLGPAELSRSADLVNDALTEMTGATSPRLHLELLVARLLLPAVDDGARGLVARLEKLERDVVGGVRVAPAPSAAPPPAATGPAATAVPGTPARTTTATGPTAPADDLAPPAPPAPPDRPQAAVGVPDAPARERDDSPRPDARAEATIPSHEDEPSRSHEDGPSVPEPVRERQSDPARPSGAPAAPQADAAPQPEAQRGTAPRPEAQRETAPQPEAQRVPQPEPVAPQPSAAAGTSGLDAETVRRRWPEVLQTLKGLRMATWVLVSQNGHVAELSEGRLSLAFNTPQLATTFRTGNHSDHVKRALHETLGLEVRVETTITGDGVPPAAPAGEPAGSGPAPARPSGDDRRRAISTEEAAASWDAPPAPRRAPQAAPDDAPAPGGAPSSRGGQRDDSSPGSAGSAAGGTSSRGRASGAGSTAGAGADRTADPTGGATDTSRGGTGGRGAPSRAVTPDDEPPPPWDIPPPDEEPLPDGPVPDPYGLRTTGGSRGGSPSASSPASGTGRPSGAGGRRAAPSATAPRYDDGEDTDPDDPDLSSTGLVGAPLIAQMLGGTVIDEVPEES
ncbi:DNA polymerase III subunit gamma and tau [Actinotalea sp. Marseille-Q4924]|uniref:DNA polymerase III subunit gamma and tau n=1 Tax=Actinotalea sp. Marseille-Q4924 TaxID=2866571 RepID=UPI001CE47C63|nr:DNA polymerase III subunit gamma and tau [Actinotalea sp. Marseille-Q4924]